MRILLTGQNGFLGKNLYTEFCQTDQVFTLGRSQHFTDWVKVDMPQAIVTTRPEVIIHAGAIANYQSLDPNIFLWNAAGTYALAKEMRDIVPNCYLVFISSRAAPWARQLCYNKASPYAISKMLAEDYITEVLAPYQYSFLRVYNLWGNESNLSPSRPGSVPFLLASHKLKYLFCNLNRDFVHVSDAVKAIRICITSRPKGGKAFDLGTGIGTSAIQLRDAIDWKDYELRFPEASRFPLSENEFAKPQNWVPGWEPQIEVVPELQELEKRLIEIQP